MGFRWRFRHSFTIIPHLLKLTINKRSWSINFHLLFYSRSWGSARTTSAIDAPGEFGLSWRKEEAHGEGGFEGLYVLATAVLLIVCALVEAARIAISDPSLLLVAVVWAVHVATVWPIRRTVLAIPLGLLALVAHGIVLTLVS